MSLLGFFRWWKCQGNKIVIDTSTVSVGRNRHLLERLRGLRQWRYNEKLLKEVQAGTWDALRSMPFLIFFMIGVSVILVVILGIFLTIADSITTKSEEYVQGYYQAIQNPINRTQYMNLTVNLYSKTFGAQTPINTFVRLQPMDSDRQYNRFQGAILPPEYRIWFDGTFCRLSPDKYERVYPCYFDLMKEPVNATWNDAVWKGNALMNFTYGGSFSVAIGAGPANEIDRTGTEHDFIQIEPVAATNSYILAQSTNLTAKLSLAVSALALLITISGFYYKALKILFVKTILTKGKTYDSY
ncbi:MAG TPA: hypothetical protein VGQ13_02290 [Nitrososphaera sp.]|nr:hypothetical protein [Nitrososphaera sp.]